MLCFTVETYIHLENMTSVILVNSENLDGVILQIHFDQRVSIIIFEVWGWVT